MAKPVQWCADSLQLFSDVLDRIQGSENDFETVIKALEEAFKDSNTSGVPPRKRRALLEKLNAVAKQLVSDEVEGRRRSEELAKNWLTYRPNFAKRYLQKQPGNSRGERSSANMAVTRSSASKKRKARSTDAESDEKSPLPKPKTKQKETSGTEHQDLPESSQSQIQPSKKLKLVYSTAAIKRTASEVSYPTSAKVAVNNAISQIDGGSTPAIGQVEITQSQFDLQNELNSTPYKGFEDPVHPREICESLDHILGEIDAAIKDGFLKAYHTRRFTASNLNSLSQELSQLLFKPVSGVDLEQQLQLLFDKDGVSVELLGRVYGTAAGVGWIWKQIDETDTTALPPELSNHFKSYGKLAPDMARIIRNKAMVDHLDEVVRPSLPAQAKIERNKFHDVLMSLRDPSPPQIKGTPNDIEKQDAIQMQKYLQYSHQVEKAFLKAYQLRLKLAKSARRYTFKYPNSGTKFDGTWMKSANTAETVKPYGKPIWACLSPAVYSADRDRNSAPALVVSALVLVQGFPLDHYVTDIL